MLPKVKQWNKWSLPSKYSAIGVFLAVIGIILSIYFWKNPVVIKTSQEKLLESKIKTKVSVSDVKFEHWLGDKESFLTIDFQNLSDYPADFFKTYLIDGDSKVNFSPSISMKGLLDGNIRVDGNNSYKVPIGPKSEIIKVLDLTKGEDFIGVGMTPEIPDELKSKYINKNKKELRIYSFISKPLLLTYSYKDIFGKDISVGTGMYFYILDGNRKATMFVIPNN